MEAISPKLKVGLGLAAAAAIFSFVRDGGGTEPLMGETFDSPLALVMENDTSPTTWNAPPVTRNPFASGELRVDDEAVEDLTTETTLGPAIAEGGVADGAASTSTSLRTLDTTGTTLSLAETIDRRLPPAAQTTTTVVPDDSQTPSTGAGAAELDG